MLTLALLAVLAVPLEDGNRWHHLSYKGIPPNRVTHAPGELRISVDKSGSPLFFRFEKLREVSAVEARGRFEGLPAEEKGDDLPLRVGLVIQGKRRLGWLERLFAPGWLKDLHDLIPDGAFAEVAFLTASRLQPPGTRRLHPKSRYVTEEVALAVKEPGPFTLKHVYPEPRPSLGLWLQADGDDTGSAFTVVLNGLALEIP